MTQRNWIYAALATILAMGVIVDEITQRTGSVYYVANLVRILAFIGLSVAWVRADALARGYRVGSVTLVLLYALTFLGMAVYLFRTRSIARALMAWVGYFGGLAMIAGVVGVTAIWLITGRLS